VLEADGAETRWRVSLPSTRSVTRHASMLSDGRSGSNSTRLGVPTRSGSRGEFWPSSDIRSHHIERHRQRAWKLSDDRTTMIPGRSTTS